jgi:hypothetical protein
MERLLTEILEEMRKQTAILERLTVDAEARDRQTEVAREALKKAAGLLKGTPFGPAIESVLMGGNHG